jgi:hypothetical protein
MMARKRQYEEDCERVQTENDIAIFEARQAGQRADVPSLPLPPKLDYDVLRSFEPPSASRFHDIFIPVTTPKAARLARDAVRPCRREMRRGCPACNPEHHDEIHPRHLAATRMGRRIQRERKPEAAGRVRNELPMQIGQAYWTVLDEPSVPARPQIRYREIGKPARFCLTRPGPRPAGIPVCKNDVIDARGRGESWFEEQMSRRDDRELLEREKALHQRALTSRQFHATIRGHREEIAQECGQKWVNIPAKRSETARGGARKNEQRVPPMSPEEAEAMADLTQYDDALYREYQATKRPTDDMEFYLERRGVRPVSSVVRAGITEIW